MRRQEFDRLEQAYLHTYPNPDRLDCPGSEILRGLASKELGIGHPARLHLMQCSPCFREFRDFMRELERIRSRKRTLTAIGVAAMLTLLGIEGTSWFGHRNSRAANPYSSRDRDTPATMISQTADLWDWPTPRGHDDHAQERSLSWSAGLIKLRVVLPRGTDGGAYRVSVTRDRSGKEVIAGNNAQSSIEQYGSVNRNVVTVVLDLRHIPSGAYYLATTDPGNISYFYPLRIS